MSKEFEFEKEEVSEDIPEYGSENWEEYVMSQFTEKELYIDEKENKYPTLNGMRRVSLFTLGRPIKSGPVSVVSNLSDASYCIYELVFENGQTFSAAADGFPNNIAGSYSIYPTAMAESRAEARAYRKALLLSTAAAEEVRGNEKVFNTVLETVKDYDLGEDISSQQISIIETKCKSMKIDKAKFLQSENVSVDYKGAKRSDGIKLSKRISEFQQKGIPNELKLN
jgi:hypothetical protein